MKTMEFNRRKKILVHLNITPLIDIVFLLLIFFMLSSNFIAQAGIKISLPAVVTGKTYQKEDIIVTITKDNDLYLNEEEITIENLLDKLRVRLEETEKKTVIIRADETINLGLAVKIIDIAKQAEVRGLVISTRMDKADAEK